MQPLAVFLLARLGARVSVAPNDKKEVQVMVTPGDKAIAGDYVASFRANGRGESSSADFRVTVTTSMIR